MKIRQWDNFDCAIACITYLVDYYKGYVPRNKIRKDTNTTKLGTNAYNVVNTLKEYGFNSCGKKVDIDSLKYTKLPCILHTKLKNGYYHFIILEKIKNNKYYIADPAKGNYTLTKTKLKLIYTNIVIEAIPKKEIIKLPKPKSILKDITKIINKNKLSIIIYLIINFITILLSLISTYEIKLIYSNLNIKTILIILTSLIILKIINELIRNNLEINLKHKLNKDYISYFYNHLFKIPIKELNKYAKGEIITRIEEAKEIKEIILELITSIITNILLITISIILFINLNNTLTYILTIGIILFLLLLSKTSKHTYNHLTEYIDNTKEERINEYNHITMNDTYSNLNIQNKFLDKLINNFKNINKRKEIESKKIVLLETIPRYYLEILSLIIVLIGIYEIKTNTLSITNFITFYILLKNINTPLDNLVSITPNYYYLKVILEKIEETLSIKEDVITNEPLANNITINLSNINYRVNENNILNNLNLTIKQKDHIYLNGKSGIGKSTLCNLIHDDITPTKGRITINNIDYKDIPKSKIKREIIYLSQKETITQNTIKDNITLGDEIDNNKLKDIINICNLNELIETKKDNLITDETISGGQKQKIMLARTLYKDANLYILDECLSEIPIKEEIEILYKLREYLKNKSLIYVSHNELTPYFNKTINLRKEVMKC